MQREFISHLSGDTLVLLKYNFAKHALENDSTNSLCEILVSRPYSPKLLHVQLKSIEIYKKAQKIQNSCKLCGGVGFKISIQTGYRDFRAEIIYRVSYEYRTNTAQTDSSLELHKMHNDVYCYSLLLQYKYNAKEKYNVISGTRKKRVLLET